VTIVLGLGIVLVVAGFVLDANRKFVIDHLTSRSLGSLAPGYAATPNGIRVYTYLVSFIGIALAGLGLSDRLPQFGAAGVVCGALGFAVFSIIAIVGEVRVYRALKH
jgi:hypothetical protein